MIREQNANLEERMAETAKNRDQVQGNFHALQKEFLVLSTQLNKSNLDYKFVVEQKLEDLNQFEQQLSALKRQISQQD